MNYLSIREFSKQANIPVRTLHYYDEIGLLLPAYIDPKNGYRYYQATQAIAVANIFQFKKAGFSLEEIKQLIQGTDYMHQQELLQRQSRKIVDEIYEKQAVLSQLRQYTQIRTSEIVYESLPGKWVVAYRSTLPAGEEKIKERFMHLLALIQKYQLQPIGVMGLINHDHYQDYTVEAVDIEVFVEVAKSLEIDEVYYRMPQRVVSYRHFGDYQSLILAYQKMLVWCEAHGLQYQGKTMEYYLIDWTKTDQSNDYVTDLHIYV